MSRTSQRITLVVRAAATAVAVAASWLPWGPSVEPVAAATAAAGSFTSPCVYSHRLNDDPIVRPGLPGASHSHDFFGNKSTNAFSTTTSLLANTTTCDRASDTAAYWVPTLLVDGKPFAAREMRVYYRTGGLKDVTKIRAFPSGFRMIAGNATNLTPQSTAVSSWACTIPGGGAAGDEIELDDLPSTCEDQPLRLRIVFPNCWNGRDLDTVDHKSHVTYSSKGVCPALYPVPLPQLTFSIRYWVKGSLDKVALASGGHHSGHADFFNAWKQKSLENLVDYCLRGSRLCDEKVV